jgi:DNA-binding MarR family transcriptional regulator
MATERLSGLQRRLLQTIYDIEAQNQWHMSASHAQLRQTLGGNKGNFSVSLHNLEAKGLVQVYRTSGGKAESAWLTPEGKNRAAQLCEVLIKEEPI